MPNLEPLTTGHEAALLAFERTNRAWFAESISDRGDDYFDEFHAGLRDLLAEQESGICAYYVLVEGDGSIIGRFNLYDLQDGAARLGYRVAQHVAGRGVATTAVRQLCGFAAERHRLQTLRAATSHRNLASQKVLLKAGFLPVGPAEPADLGGQAGTWYERQLADPQQPRGALGPDRTGPERTDP